MSNRGYAVLLVLAGVVCGILAVSLASSPAAAKLPTEDRVIAQPVKAITPSVRPAVAAGNIRVYPVGMGGNNNRNDAHAYVVKDGKLWHCENATAHEVNFR
ncbi:MAG: hypothetical protein JXN61_15785 [Sedimentisphaerales bacterium]|nr:hypothetical protein [Sedimentisphaerales bacterium]